ncbi:hypothetical protein CLG_B0630 [Clostridium botulinum D str. 1873]|uniref:Uncharacterized protein n=1 Tax=Clostridium botulinum D str. 1873 TaxID=592027 RepID=A0A9P2G6E0_CLOBO|nr:hypothetical protein CLG_B0630 [Clostridium botulinum D str. 1873]
MHTVFILYTLFFLKFTPTPPLVYFNIYERLNLIITIFIN